MNKVLNKYNKDSKKLKGLLQKAKMYKDGSLKYFR